MPKLTNITKTIIDLLNEHEKNQLPPRKRNPNKSFPLWVALRSFDGRQSKIDAVLSGRSVYPFVGQSTPKQLIAEKLLSHKSITAVQFNLIDGYLCDRGYYNGHWAVDELEPPNTVIPVGRGRKYGVKSIADYDIDDWMNKILLEIQHTITLKSILDDAVTDLILIKALDITARLAKSKTPKNWMYSGA